MRKVLSTFALVSFLASATMVGMAVAANTAEADCWFCNFQGRCTDGAQSGWTECVQINPFECSLSGFCVGE